MASREASLLVKDTARRILRYLRAHPWGASKEALCEETQVSPPSIQRALTWLRDTCDSPLEFDRAEGRWVLRDLHFTLPLSDPEPEDLNAVLFAEALLAPIADEEITARLRRLAEQMDGEIRQAGHGNDGARHGALVATVTTGTRTDPDVLASLLTSVGKRVVQVRYRSPWTRDGAPKVHLLEPWQLRIHDGGLYLRAWSRSHGEPRSFRVAQIEHASVQPEAAEDEPRQTIPPPAEIWGHGDPAFGIDHDRPGTARIVIRAPTARWVHQNLWDPGQRDCWLEDQQLLERVVEYRSCRELARRLLSLGSDVVEVEPAELRDEMLRHLRGLVSSLDP